MKNNKLKILLIIEQCNPEWPSVPLVGYSFYKHISLLVNTTLVTHARNKEALDKAHPDRDIIYISESSFIHAYYKIAEKFSKIGNKIIWPLYNTLTYPVYGEFNHLVYTRLKSSILNGHYDIVHAITPILPRYPVKAIKACQKTPFIIGPVNGGVPFPKGFQAVARQEFSYFNFLRQIGRLIIPGYRATYQKADYILSGSTYTLNFIKDLFAIESSKIELFYENGIENAFIKEEESLTKNKNKDHLRINLLFVGRLVPYKGADILIEAISNLEQSIQNKILLTVVGDGPERNRLEQLVQKLHLTEKVTFTGWIEQQKTVEFYSCSDLFCFPSVREFGGAVVLEAMANGLPCIVINNGGIAEYVTEQTGFKINPISREYVVKELTACIEKLVQNPALREKMSRSAVQRAKEFSWSAKAEAIVALYHKLLSNRAKTASR
jgi:glycosyltransferase involved in cell wall biosynthesis